jgi:hypothetical protein
MTNPIVGAINGGIIGMITGAGLGFVHYPFFNKLYTERQRMLYDNNGAVIFLTGIGGGFGGCIAGAIGGFHSADHMNDWGVVGGLAGGTIGGLVGSASSIVLDSRNASNP